ncbi:reverse transcriptase domain-containing protein [Tanacetum coccineum]
MDVCHALADLGASINLMPLSIWKKLSLPELTPTRMTLELADRSITRPKGVAEDVFVKVGSFHFPTNFIVVDFEADPRVPLIFRRLFLRTNRALIDVYEGELILRDGDERLIFHVDKHPQKHAKESINIINFIEDGFREVLRLKKSNHFSSGSTTPFSDSRPNFTSFETSDSLLEEFADELAFLDPFPSGNVDVDVEAELREIELLFNRDPSTNFSPRITFDPNPKRFTNEPSLVFTLHREYDMSGNKNDHFDAKSYLPELPLNHDTLIVFSPRNDPLHHEFAGEIITPPSRIAREHEEYISRMWIVVNSIGRDRYILVPVTVPPEIKRDDYDSKDDENSTVDEPILLHTPFLDEDECFNLGGDNDDIDAFLAIEVPMYIEEGYYDSDGEYLLFLKSLLIDDTTLNLFSEVRILQKSQENGQNWTNTDTGMERVHKSQEFDSKKVK